MNPILHSPPRSSLFSHLRWHALPSFAGVFLFVISSGFLSAAETPFAPLWKFTADEKWQAEWLDKVNPAPFLVTTDDKGVTVGFPAATTDSSCPLRAIRWREIDPLGIAPTQFSLDASMQVGTGIALAPRVLNTNGNSYQLAPKPVTGGTLTWDLSTDLKAKMLKKNMTEPVPPGTVLAGPVYLDEIEVIKTAGAAATVRFTKGQVVDPQAGTMAFGTDFLWNFDEERNWLDVNAFDESLYKMTNQPDGLAVTYGPTPKHTTFKIGCFSPLTSDGAIGKVARVISDIELVEGPAGCATVGLGLKDSENEVVSSRGVPLNPGHNFVVWDATDIASPWRGGHNGMVDFPVGLDDYTLVMNGTTVETKVVFHSAVKEVLHKLVYASGYDTDRRRYVWNPGEVASIKVHLVNLGKTTANRTLNVTLSTDQEKELWNHPVQVSIPAGGKADFSADVDTKGLLHGVYILRWTSPEAADDIKGQALLTVSDTDPIPKAKDGEFLYGVDLGVYKLRNQLDWVDWCGIDVIRNAGRDEFFRPGIAPRHLAFTQAALDALAKRGLRANIMLSPSSPWDKDPAKFDKIVADEANIAGTLAANFKGKFLWWEYGNEPSLQPFFFHGPPADYVRLYLAVHDAIKAADPTALVTNGGWAFSGAGGAEQRAREMAKLIPADKIDGWAYHGHGEGSKAERHWLDLARSAANYPDKKDKPFYETESGVTSTDPATWRTQARTLIQKLSYAQSTHQVPCFLWFGLFPLWEWGILENFDEGKPAALAYRVLVQRTRGLRAQDPLDLAGAPGEAYWFTNDTGKTTVVLWSDTGEYSRNLAFGTGTTNIVRYDMFGNPTPLTLGIDGAVPVQVGPDPVYVCAQRPPGSPTLAALPPMLEVPNVLRVVPGSQTNLAAKVHNHTATDLDGTLVVSAQGTVPVTGTQAPIRAASGGNAQASIPVTITDAPLDWWPHAWIVYAPVVGDVDLSTMTAIPDSLPSDGKTLTPQVAVIGEDGHAELGSLGGGYHERRQSLCFASVNVPDDVDVEFGASADFWMEWYLNGQRIFSTMDTGNGGPFAITTHVIKAHFKKGHNLLAVRVLSGSAGWELVSGGPEKLASAKRAASGIYDGVLVELKSGDQVLDHEMSRLEVLPPLAAKEGDNWATVPADSELGFNLNFFKAAPDATHWYHGKADLSGRIWYRAQPDGSLLVESAVTDDIDQPGDGIHIEVASGADWGNRVKVSSGQPQVSRRRDEATTTTWYEAVIPAADLKLQPKQPLAIKVTVDDDDWGALKQTETTAWGDDPATWYQTWFPGN